MSVENSIRIVGEITGLGEGQKFAEAMATTTTCTKFYHGVQIQAVADTAEALELGNVATPQLVLLKCITNDVDVDVTYSSSFNAELTVNEGEFALFKPYATTYIKNNDSSEQSTIEVYVWGT
jgi:hypothetical protein